MVPLAMMESRAWGANRVHDPGGQGVLSARPHAGLTGCHPLESAAQREGSDLGLLDPRVPLEGTLITPDPPGDSSDAIGEGDGGDIVAAGCGSSNGPGLELVGFPDAVSSEESSTGTVDQERAGVGISALGNPAEATGEA